MDNNRYNSYVIKTAAEYSLCRSFDRETGMNLVSYVNSNGISVSEFISLQLPI